MKDQIVDGTYYDHRTAPEVVRALEYIRKMGARIRLYYGDVKTGRSWLEGCDVTGTLSRSTGPHKIPILIYNSRSLGGGALLDHCIIGIKGSCRCYRWYYKHANFHTPRLKIVASDMKEYEANVLTNGSIHTRFKTFRAAERYVAKMKGE